MGRLLHHRILFVGNPGNLTLTNRHGYSIAYSYQKFPEVSYEDNIRAQYAVLQQLGIKKVYAIVGFFVVRWVDMYNRHTIGR